MIATEQSAIGGPNQWYERLVLQQTVAEDSFTEGEKK